MAMTMDLRFRGNSSDPPLLIHQSVLRRVIVRCYPTVNTLPTFLMSESQTIDEAIEAEASTAGTPPVKKLHHKGVSLSIFTHTVTRDDGSEFTIHNTSIERRYKDKDGNFQTSHSFNEEQLAVLEDLARDARGWIRGGKSS